MPLRWYEIKAHAVQSWWRRFFVCFGNFFEDLRSQWSRAPLDRCRWMKFPAARQSVSNNPKDVLARAGEAEAVRFLREKGYLILHQNILLPGGELDIVAQNNKMLVFVEVKTRTKRDRGGPLGAVKSDKQQRLIALAQRFLTLCSLHGTPIRFDIISVVWPKNARPEITHFENAFRPRDLKTRGRTRYINRTVVG